MSEKTKKKGNKKVSTVLTNISVAIVLFLIVLQIVSSILAVSNFGVPRIGDYQVLVVLTDSMEPSYKVGTAVFVKKVPLDTIMPSSSIEAHDGDTITFYRTLDKKVITHRVIEVIETDGVYSFKTLGDNLHAGTCPTGGCIPTVHFDYVEARYVIGKVIGQSRIFGTIYYVASNPWFIAVFAVIPLLIVLIASIKDLGKQVKELKKDGEGGTPSAEETTGPAFDEDEEFSKIKEHEKLKMLIELEKEKLRAEMKKKGNDHDS